MPHLSGRAPKTMFVSLSLDGGGAARLAAWVGGGVANEAAVRADPRAPGCRELRSGLSSNSIDADIFRRDTRQRATLRQELAVKPDDVVVAVGARVHPQKDWPTICE